jgi:EmrB/QacA subfamily drug resistance transporter
MTRRQLLVLTASGGVAAMTTIDTTVVNVALPSIRSEFNASITSVQWVVTSYTLVFAILMVPAGRIADMFGRERVWAAGVAIFAIASLGCALAPNLGFLLAGRVVEGIGAAAIKPTTVAMVAAAFPADRRGWALGIMGSALAGAAAFGPAIGGTLAEAFGWRAIFVVNVPIAVAAITVMRRIAASAAPAERSGRVDVTGAGVLGSCLLLIILALTQADEWGARWTLGLLAAAAALGVLFVIVELRSDAPVLELRLLKRPAFAAGNAITMLTSLGFFGAFFLQSLYLQEVAGFSIVESGLLLAPLGTATLVTSMVGGRLSDRVGPRVPIAVGLALCLAGLVLLTRVGPDSSYAGHVLAAYVLEGAGWGLASAPLNSAVISAAGIDRAGQAAGLMSTLDKFGAALGVAVASAVFTARSDDALSDELSAVGVRLDSHQIQELRHVLGSDEIQGHVGRIVPGDPSAALRAVDAAFMASFDLVMALSAAVFGLALLIAVLGLRAEPGRRPARTSVLARLARDARHHRVPGRFEG